MKTVTLILGFVLLALGIAAFIPGLAVDGVLFGMVPVTTMLALAFIFTGAIGVMIGLSHRRGLPPMAGEGNDLRNR
jgi:uncharacterized membrane protein HdeD (DUF308 family)